MSGKEGDKPMWIPVTERLPECGVRVLIYSKELGVRFSNRLYHHENGRPFVVEYEGYVKVTHWMPIPEPPEDN